MIKCIFGIISASFFCFSASAQNTLISTERLQAFGQTHFAEAVSNGDAPGAYFTVSMGGQVLVNQAWGVRDIQTGVPIDPADSVFRVASVAKGFVNIAALKMIEEGRLSLEDDISQYLPNLPFDTNFDAPITIAHLLSHTEGFEETYTRILAVHGTELPTTLHYLQENRPARIYAPGEALTYGSYGTIVLGHILENVSGKPFAEIMQEIFFTPLGMDNSSFIQPIPDLVLENLVFGHLEAEGGFASLPLIYPTGPAAGGAYASGDDIGRFLNFLSNKGGQYLSNESFSYVTDVAYTPSVEIPGITSVYFQHIINGEKVLVRNGDGPAFRSTVYYFPEHDLSFFMLYNSGSDRLRGKVIAAFMAEFFPNDTVVDAETDMDIASLSGTYRPIQANQTGLGKVQMFFAGPIKVMVEGERLIVNPGPHGDVYGGFEARMEFLPIGRGVFTTQDGNNQVVFYDDGDGIRIASSLGYHGVFQRVTFFENTWLHLGLTTFWSLGLIIFLLWALAFGLRRLFDKTTSAYERNPVLRLKWLVFTTGFVALLYASAVNYFIIVGDGAGMVLGMPVYFFSISPLLAPALYLPWLIVLLVLMTMGAAAKARAPKTILTLALVAVAALLWQGWFLNYWALL